MFLHLAGFDARMVFFHRSWLLVLILAGTASLCSCRSVPAEVEPKLPAPEMHGKLRVGVSETAPPMIHRQEDNVVGVEADLANALGEAIGREVEFVSMFWPNLIWELQGGRIDIVMSGMSVTERRKRRVAFAEPYMTTGQQAMVRASDLQALGTVQAVLATDRRVGAEVGTTAMRFVQARMNRCSKARFPTVAKAIEALEKGEIDVVVHDSPAIQWYAAKSLNGGLVAVPGLMTREKIAWAVNRSNLELLEKVNDLLATWKRDGTIAMIIDRWLPNHR